MAVRGIQRPHPGRRIEVTVLGHVDARSVGDGRPEAIAGRQGRRPRRRERRRSGLVGVEAGVVNVPAHRRPAADRPAADSLHADLAAVADTVATAATGCTAGPGAARRPRGPRGAARRAGVPPGTGGAACRDRSRRAACVSPRAGRRRRSGRTTSRAGNSAASRSAREAAASVLTCGAAAAAGTTARLAAASTARPAPAGSRRAPGKDDYQRTPESLTNHRSAHCTQGTSTSRVVKLAARSCRVSPRRPRRCLHRRLRRKKQRHPSAHENPPLRRAGAFGSGSNMTALPLHAASAGR